MTDKSIRKRVATLAAWCWGLMAFCLPFSTALTIAFSVCGTLFSLASMRFDYAKEIVRHPLSLLLIGLFLWTTLSVLWSIAPTAELIEAWSKYRKLLFPLVIALALIDGEKQDGFIWHFFLAGCFFVVIGSLFSSLGFWDHILGPQSPQGGWAVFGTPEKHAFYIGPPSQPTFGRSYIGQGLMLVIGSLILLNRLSERSGKRFSLPTYFGWIAYLIVCYVLWSLNGRTGMVLYVVGTVAWLLKKYDHSNPKIFMYYTFGLVVVVSMLTLLNPSSKSRLIDIGGNSIAMLSEKTGLTSESIRIGFWAAGIKYFIERPITGWGVGSYAELYSKDVEQPELLKLDRAQPHSEVVIQAVQGGGVALLIYALINVSVLGYYVAILRKTEINSQLEPIDHFSISVSSVLMLFDGMFNSIIWDLAEGHAIALILGYIIFTDLKYKRYNRL